ncbi:hypothetical protein HDU76_002877, partial [Blyttiomyces sp. JEL0837]
MSRHRNSLAAGHNTINAGAASSPSTNLNQPTGGQSQLTTSPAITPLNPEDDVSGGNTSVIISLNTDPASSSATPPNPPSPKQLLASKIQAKRFDRLPVVVKNTIKKNATASSNQSKHGGKRKGSGSKAGKKRGPYKTGPGGGPRKKKFAQQNASNSAKGRDIPVAVGVPDLEQDLRSEHSSPARSTGSSAYPTQFHGSDPDDDDEDGAQSKRSSSANSSSHHQSNPLSPARSCSNVHSNPCSPAQSVGSISVDWNASNSPILTPSAPSSNHADHMEPNNIQIQVYSEYVALPDITHSHLSQLFSKFLKIRKDDPNPHFTVFQFLSQTPPPIPYRFYKKAYFFDLSELSPTVSVTTEAANPSDPQLHAAKSPSNVPADAELSPILPVPTSTSGDHQLQAPTTQSDNQSETQADPPTIQSANTYAAPDTSLSTLNVNIGMDEEEDNADVDIGGDDVDDGVDNETDVVNDESSPFCKAYLLLIMSAMKSAKNKKSKNDSRPGDPTFFRKDFKSKLQQRVQAAVTDGTMWVAPMDPTIALKDSLAFGDSPHPRFFYFRNCFMWLPDMTFGKSCVKCPYCKISNYNYKEFCSRKVYGLHFDYNLVTRRVKCNGCNQKFRLSQPDVITLMPRHVQDAFPCFLTKKAAVDLEVLKLLEFGCDNTLGPANLHQFIKEKYTLRHSISMSRYYHTIEHLHHSQKILRGVKEFSLLDLASLKSIVPTFSDFKKKSEYNGVYPSGSFLKVILCRYINKIRPWFDLEVQRRTGTLLSFDHTFKITNSLAKVNGIKTFNTLATAKNEYGEIRFQKFTQSTSMREVRYNLELLKQSLFHFGRRELVCVYVDNCCQVRNLWERIFPSLRRDKFGVPLLDIPKDVNCRLLSTKSHDGLERQISVSLDYLLEQLDQSPEPIPMALDTEWQVIFMDVDANEPPPAGLEVDRDWDSEYPHYEFVQPTIGPSANNQVPTNDTNTTQTNTRKRRRQLSQEGSSSQPLPSSSQSIPPEQPSTNTSNTTDAPQSTRPSLQPTTNNETTPATTSRSKTAFKDGRVCLIQLAFTLSGAKNVLLFQLQRKDTVASFPRKLRQVLEHKNARFAGRSIKSMDVRHLRKDWGLDITDEQLVPLEEYCFDRGWVDRKTYSLDQLSRAVLKERLAKDPSIRLSNWFNKLSEDQIMYAARDAFASLRIYETVATSAAPPTPITIESTCAHGGDSTCVKCDALHCIMRITDACEDPKSNPFVPLLSSALSLAIFSFHEGDQKIVDECLRQRREKPTTFEKMLEANPDYINSTCRRVIDQPDILLPRLKELENRFCAMKDGNGKPLGTPKLHQAFQNLYEHVKRGCLSDPTGYTLYYPLHKNKDGLQTWRCARGTSHLESFHQKVVDKFSAWNAGPEFADVALAIIRHRGNIRASEKNRPRFPVTGHYDHFIFDEIQAVLTRLDITIFQWWPPANYAFAQVETFGISPSSSPNPQAKLPTSDELKKLPQGYRYIAERTCEFPPILPVQTLEEMSLFKETIQNYCGEAVLSDKMSKGKNIDWNQMASDWNDGKLKLGNGKLSAPPLAGNSIFRKLPENLEQYYKVYLVAMDKRFARRQFNKDLLVLRQNHFGLAEDVPEDDPEDLPHPQAETDFPTYVVDQTNRSNVQETLDADDYMVQVSLPTPQPQLSPTPIVAIVSHPSSSTPTISTTAVPSQSSTLVVYSQAQVEPDFRPAKKQYKCRSCGFVDCAVKPCLGSGVLAVLFFAGRACGAVDELDEISSNLMKFPGP